MCRHLSIRYFVLRLFLRTVWDSQQNQEVQRFLIYSLPQYTNSFSHYQHYSPEWYFFFFLTKYERTLGTSLVTQMVKSLPAMQGTSVYLWVGEIPWRRKWQPTVVFLPGKSHGWWNLIGCSPWGLSKPIVYFGLHSSPLVLYILRVWTNV